MTASALLPDAPDGHPPAAVVFDVDGTLYRQRGLRLRMMLDLLWAASFSAHTRRDLRILKRFRRERETLAAQVSSGFENAQYEVVAEALDVPVGIVREAVRTWISEHPLRYLRGHRTPGIRSWIEALRGEGIATGVYSEYPAEDKLQALGITVDVSVSSTDVEVDAFKPDPKGLLVALRRLGVPPERAVYVGDRDDRDRPCAEAAGTAFLHIRDWSRSGVALQQ